MNWRREEGTGVDERKGQEHGEARGDRGFCYSISRTLAEVA